MSLLLNRTDFGNPINRNNVLSKTEAQALLNEWVLNPKLMLHMRQVGYLMKCWAQWIEKLGAEEQWKWQLAGLLHDADWDQWPELHCKKIIEELERQNIDPEIIRAIASHGPVHFGVQPKSRMDKALFAFDELSGLIHAYSLMRPNGYEGMDLKSVQKRIKDKKFAANVSRADIYDACVLLGVELEVLILFIIEHQPQAVFEVL